MTINVDSKVAYIMDSGKGFIVKEESLAYTIVKSTIYLFGLIHFNSLFFVSNLEKVQVILHIVGS